MRKRARRRAVEPTAKSSEGPHQSAEDFALEHCGDLCVRRRYGQLIRGGLRFINLGSRAAFSESLVEPDEAGADRIAHRLAPNRIALIPEPERSLGDAATAG